MSDQPMTPEQGTEFLNEYVNQEVLLVMVHIPSKVHVASQQSLKRAGAWADACVANFTLRNGGVEEPVENFIIVEIRKGGAIRCTTLEEFRNGVEADPMLNHDTKSE